MGVRQSKRSVDITTKDGEAVGVKSAALDGKLERIEEADLKAKVANGHAEVPVDTAKVSRVSRVEWSRVEDPSSNTGAGENARQLLFQLFFFLAGNRPFYSVLARGGPLLKIRVIYSCTEYIGILQEYMECIPL